MLGSSVWAEAPETRCVWITLLCLADAEGKVAISTSGLARLANVELQACKTAIETLQAPDLDSKSPEWGGRRIEKIDGGWLILGYKKYREMRSPKQIADAERKADWRSRQREKVGQDASNPDDDLESLLNGLPDDDARRAWSAEIEAHRNGMHGAPMTDQQIARACRDYVGNGHLKSPSLRHFRAFLRDARRSVDSVSPKRNGANGAKSKLENGRQNLDESIRRRESRHGLCDRFVDGKCVLGRDHSGDCQDIDGNVLDG